jgi:HK97 family phage major capsid protein
MGRPINTTGGNTMYIKKPFVPLLKLDIQFFAENKKDGEPDLKTLQTEFNASWKSLKTLLDQQADEMRTHGETAQSTADSITAIEQKINQYEQELKGVTDKYKEFETKMQRPSFGGGERAKSAGDLLIESDSYKNMGSGEFKASQSLKGFFTKDLDSTDPKGGYLVSPQTVAGVLTPPQEDLRIRDLLNVQRTTSNAIEYIVETGFTNASAVAPEKSLKPQSDLTFDIESATVKTLAHWIPATRQIIQDAPMLRNYVDGRLTYGLALTEEAQILYGDGVGDNMAGIMTNPNVQNVGGVAAADTRIDHLRRAITRTLLAGYPATGIVLHPSDWEDIELQKGTDGHYIWVSVVNGGETRLWRVPVVQSTGMNEGEFLVGAFGLAGQLWDREQANVRISEHHADYFARNMLAILAEERLALTVYRPEAFVRGAFTAAV